ncbi:hypothetical protein [Labrys neptuniae]
MTANASTNTGGYAYTAVFNGTLFQAESAEGLALAYRQNDRAIPLWLATELMEKGYDMASFDAPRRKR